MTDSTVAASQVIGMSVLIVHAIEWLKVKKWCPWITADSAEVNRTVAAIAALLSSAGFAFVLVGSARGGGQLTITFPPLTVFTVGSICMRALVQLGAQQVYYRAGVKADPVVAK